MLRNCHICKEKSVEYIPHENNKSVFWKQWITEKEQRISGKTKKDITVQRTFKKFLNGSAQEMKNHFQKNLPKFMAHVARINHQYEVCDHFKKNLSDKDILLQIDFSQNFLTKYAEEPQSVHFGASRQQITLHTGVLFTKSSSQSFCTISEFLRHDPSAVIAHITPIVNTHREANPKITHLHFISDGPATQYRNKYMFFLLTTYLPIQFEQITAMTYNFSEAGHGKSPADGVGAVVKRAADHAIAYGQDVANIDSLLKVLLKKVKNVLIKVITPASIDEIDKHLPTDLKTFQGTMKVHQWIWQKSNKNWIFFNEMSCYDCPRNRPCVHYNLGKAHEMQKKAQKRRKEEPLITKTPALERPKRHCRKRKLGE